MPTASVTSQPEKIQVLLDGRSRGRTPLEIQAHYPGTRAVEWVPPPPASPGGAMQPRVVELVNLRPAPPAWLFPLDFPLDLALNLFSQTDLLLEASLALPEQGPVQAPTEREIANMARRAQVFGLRRPE